MKTVLVAGGAGFIGSHVCGALLDQNVNIICIDNLLSGDKNNISSFIGNSRFLFIQYDTKELYQGNLPFSGPIDEIYDLASPASVTYISEYPIEAATANSIGTKNLLDIAVKFHATFLFASSSEVYGDPKVHPQAESYWGNVNPIGIRSGYDEGKRFGEALTMAYHREKKVDTRIVRIFNTYGPHSSVRDSRIIPRFVSQALRGLPLTVHGDGHQTRSFCYVSDMVDGLLKLMESKVIDPVNIGNPIEYTVLDIAKKIINETKSSSKISFVERPPDDPSRRKPDISQAKLRLLWEPKINIEEGLYKTIEYFNSVI